MIRHNTRCYFIARAEADMSQLNLPHETNNYNVEKQEKLKSKNGYAQKYR